MESPNSTLSPAPSSHDQVSSRFLLRLRNQLGQNLIPTLGIVAATSAVLVGTSAWKTWTVYQDFRSAVSRNFTLQKLSDRVVYFDEIMSMSAQTGAIDSNTNWIKRYDEFAPQLDAALAELLEIAPEYKNDISQTDTANQKLIELETLAFQMVRDGESDQAREILFGDEYRGQKKIYSQGITATLDSIQTAVDAQIETYSRELSSSALLATLSFPLLLASWTVVLALVRSYIQDQKESQAAIQELNAGLEERVRVRTEQLASQEQATREESEVLQTDVAMILDAVSAVEGGDFTIEAPVSDRVTGLVADTLNRLIEELGRVLSQVWNASQQVSTGAQQLGAMAVTVTENTAQQASSVERVLQFTEQVEQSAQASVQQIQVTMQALQQVSGSAAEGEVAIAALNQGIEILQQGTDQIVQQMKTLGEFVGLTDQFLQEQSQIASMTQVLAMNASLVAARGSEQRDPTQFVVVAREFEAIANQVSNLAQRTSTGLVSLEQRSSQIHNVVSSVDTNVQNLGNLVRQFNQGVDRSREAFGEVASSAQQSVQTGAALKQSNQQIAEATLATAELMREIAAFSQQTAQLTQRSQQQSGQMEDLSSRLLETVQFFRLPQTMLAASIASAQQQSAAIAPSAWTEPKALSEGLTEQTEPELVEDLTEDLTRDFSSSDLAGDFAHVSGSTPVEPSFEPAVMQAATATLVKPEAIAESVPENVTKNATEPVDATEPVAIDSVTSEFVTSEFVITEPAEIESAQIEPAAIEPDPFETLTPEQTSPEAVAIAETAETAEAAEAAETAETEAAAPEVDGEATPS